MREGLKLIGELTITVKDKEGKVKDTETVRNLIVNVGKAEVARLINGVSTKPFQWLQVGGGGTSPTPDDTALEDFIAEGQATVEYEADNKARWTYTFTFAAATILREAGIFNDQYTNSPVMLARQIYNDKPVSAGESVEVVWVVFVA